MFNILLEKKILRDVLFVAHRWLSMINFTPNDMLKRVRNAVVLRTTLIRSEENKYKFQNN